MKLIFLVALCYLLPASEPRLVAFVANSTHIVTYNSSPEGHLTYESIHQNPSDSAWISVWPTTNPTSMLATSTNTDGRGSIALYSINSGSGQLTRRAQQNTSGLNPAYVSWDVRGNWAFVANYGSGDANSTGANLAVLPVNRSNGTIGVPASITNHTGNGTNPDRQTGPHPHMIAIDYSNQFVFSPDLGTDKTYQYVFNQTSGNLTPSSIPYASPSQDGAGPRHFALHPDRLFAYVINELLSTIDVYLYDSTKGLLTALVQSVSTVPQNWVGQSDAAEIVVTPDGKFLYASNRGYDSIVGFYIDPTSTDFNLKRIGWTTYRMSTPRNFAIDPTGRLLLVGASTTNEIVAFNIGGDGILMPTGSVTSMAGAISIVLCEIN